jgi:predicted N-acetyltransferase YhbS
LARAKVLGHHAVLVIGPPDYYQPFGFSAELTRGLTLPKPVDNCRFQACELAPGALSGISGAVAPVQ